MSNDAPENQQLLEFPCEFPIKMMGRDDPNFRDTVVDIVERHVGEVSENAIRVAPSRRGTFVSITITVSAQSQQQLDEIYRDLTANKNVLVSL